MPSADSKPPATNHPPVPSLSIAVTAATALETQGAAPDSSGHDLSTRPVRREKTANEPR
jgi:hypothetical protein